MHTAPPEPLSLLSHLPEQIREVERNFDYSVDAGFGLVHGTEHTSRGGASVTGEATSDERGMAIEVLAAALEHHRGPRLEPIVAALEAVGLTVAPIVGTDGRTSLYRLHASGPKATWALSRPGLDGAWYGSPVRGPAPHGLGPAPGGRALAIHLLALALVNGGVR